MPTRHIKGLIYPDDYFIKFFFKHQLHNKKGLTFLELGCSNGCNLMLPYQFLNNVVGVDMNDVLIDYANSNFYLLNQVNNYKFFNADMRVFCTNKKNIKADVLILANSVYYIPKNDFITLLKDIRKNNLIKTNALFFLRFRELDHFSNKKGKRVGENSYILENGITGEDGVFCKFYDTFEMIDILKVHLNLKNFQVMKIKYENMQKNIKVNNSDVVIWGVIN
jgi:hypothetical protein